MAAEDDTSQAHFPSLGRAQDDGASFAVASLLRGPAPKGLKSATASWQRRVENGVGASNAAASSRPPVAWLADLASPHEIAAWLHRAGYHAPMTTHGELGCARCSPLIAQAAAGQRRIDRDRRDLAVFE